MRLIKQTDTPLASKVEIFPIATHPVPLRSSIKWSKIPEPLDLSQSDRSDDEDNSILVDPISYLDLSEDSDCNLFDDDDGPSSPLGRTQRNLLNVLGNDTKTFKEVILVTISIFQGYAILVVFQNKLAHEIGIKTDRDPRSAQFHFAVSFLYIGNLVFRCVLSLRFVARVYFDSFWDISPQKDLQTSPTHLCIPSTAKVNTRKHSVHKRNITHGHIP